MYVICVWKPHKREGGSMMELHNMLYQTVLLVSYQTSLPQPSLIESKNNNSEAEKADEVKQPSTLKNLDLWASGLSQFTKSS